MSSSDAAALELRASTHGGKGKREERGGEGRGKGKEGEGEEGIHGPGPARPARAPYRYSVRRFPSHKQGSA